MTTADLIRQLEKVRDAVEVADAHFQAESRMNAALHMNPTVRPAPLAVAVATALDDLTNLIVDLTNDENGFGK